MSVLDGDSDEDSDGQKYVSWDPHIMVRRGFDLHVQFPEPCIISLAPLKVIPEQSQA